MLASRLHGWKSVRYGEQEAEYVDAPKLSHSDQDLVDQFVSVELALSPMPYPT